MNLYIYLLDILKFTVSGVAVVWIAFYLFKPYLDKSEKLQILELKKLISGQTLPLRLQAYERLVLFIERVNPANMLVRLNATAYSAHDLYSLVVEEVRNEYQHNITQQIYVNGRSWAVVKHIKDDTLNIINNAVKSLPESATGLDLSKTVLAYMSRLEDNPYDIATNMLRKDLEELF
ncbi:MAG: hypothetical protein JWR02_1603 [Mucilaginibacter sp.]|nr:hypothetical protein [Mucilaginibacter sp.]